jgi:hypothetical protein
MLFSLCAGRFIRPNIVTLPPPRIPGTGTRNEATVWHQLAFALDIIAIIVAIAAGYYGLHNDFLSSHHASQIFAFCLIGSGCAYFVACLIWTYYLVARAHPQFPYSLYRGNLEANGHFPPGGGRQLGASGSAPQPNVGHQPNRVPSAAAHSAVRAAIARASAGSSPAGVV